MTLSSPNEKEAPITRAPDIRGLSSELEKQKTMEGQVEGILFANTFFHKFP